MTDANDAFLYHIVTWAFLNQRVRHVAVAVSGGGDSMALLDLVQHWAFGERIKLSAVTVNHGLRPEAADEAAMVARFCADRNIPHETLLWTGWDGSGNLQNAARKARYRLIADWAKGRGVDTICLGHTLDDQAETFLLRLARKAGSDGLRGMPHRFERLELQWVRPVLSMPRADLRAFLKRKGIPWVEDPSNDDQAYDRVKARKVLAALAPMGIDSETLAAVAHNLSMENSLIRTATQDALQGKVTEYCGSLSIAERDYITLHPEVQRRFLNAVIGWISKPEYPPRAGAHVDFEVGIMGGKPRTLGGVIGWKAKGRFWFAREYERVKTVTGLPFDGRWDIQGKLDGLEVRALGAEGLKQLPDWRKLNIPRRVLLPTPAVWKGDWLVAAPLVGLENGFKASQLGPSFDNWLRQH